MTRQDRIDLINEAVALERAGSRWTQKHAAAIVGVSPTKLRYGGCPKRKETSDGAHGKLLVWYDPQEVRAWMQARNLKSLSEVNTPSPR